MHAILALGASHLDRAALTNDHTTSIIVHRGHAIKGLNEALTKTDRTSEESDVMLATTYALTFQASYMGDGLIDFITMVRGCALVTEKIRKEGIETAFRLESGSLGGDMEARLREIMRVDQAVLEAGVVSLQSLTPFLHNITHHVFHTALFNALLALQASTAAGYPYFLQIYQAWYDLSHEDFKVLVDSNSLTTQLLLAHFIGLQMIMVPLTHNHVSHGAERVRAEFVLGKLLPSSGPVSLSVTGFWQDGKARKNARETRRWVY